MEFTVEGKIVRIFERLSGTSKAGKLWEKQEYLVETLDGKESYKFSVFGTDRVNSIKADLGDLVKVTFTISCREWNGRYYTDLNAEFIDKLQVSAPEVQQAVQPTPVEDLDSSDLPF